MHFKTLRRSPKRIITARIELFKPVTDISETAF